MINVATISSQLEIDEKSEIDLATILWEGNEDDLWLNFKYLSHIY